MDIRSGEQHQIERKSLHHRPLYFYGVIALSAGVFLTGASGEGCSGSLNPGANTAGNVDMGQASSIIKPPHRYLSLIENAARTCSVLNVPLFEAQLYKESGYNPDAVSSAGAIGIGQFLQSTWDQLVQEGKASGSPKNPSDAIPAAAAYDCEIASQVSGHCNDDPVSCMLAAYNAGPGAVIGAGGVPGNSQTLAYVKQIESLAGYTPSP